MDDRRAKAGTGTGGGRKGAPGRDGTGGVGRLQAQQGVAGRLGPYGRRAFPVDRAGDFAAARPHGGRGAGQAGPEISCPERGICPAGADARPQPEGTGGVRGLPRRGAGKSAGVRGGAVAHGLVRPDSAVASGDGGLPEGTGPQGSGAAEDGRGTSEGCGGV